MSRKSKLTDSDIREIVRLGSLKHNGHREIGRKFGISQSYASSIISAGGRPDFFLVITGTPRPHLVAPVEHCKSKLIPVLPKKMPGSSIEPPSYSELTAGRASRHRAKA